MEDVKVNVKIKLSALWAAVTLTYLYGDYWGLYMPGYLEEIISGDSLFSSSQETLLGVAILLVIPGLMVFLSLALKPIANRWANIILGIFFTAFVLMTLLLPGPGLYYIFLSIVEMVLTLLIVWHAWKWPTQKTSAP